MKEKSFYIGIDNAGDINPDWVENSINFHMVKKLGAEFVIYHYHPSGNSDDEIRHINSLSALFEQHDVQYILNTELANWFLEWKDADGWDWCKSPGGMHRFTFKPEVLRHASRSRAFAGVMYDEAEHMQINRSWVHDSTGNKVDLPFLSDTTGLSFEQADRLIYDNAVELVGECRGLGAPYVFTEHVFPVLFHTFARAGMTAVYKQLKENWAPVWAACAMGAALQYDRELWACLDLWCLDQYPGHSPEELKSNLLFGYWMGNDRLYVENLNYKGGLYAVEQESGDFRLSPWGEVYRWFTQEYLPVNPRDYSFRDVKPEIAIIRFDDTDCGQAASHFWPDWLLGSRSLSSDEDTTNWMKIWHVITHGVMPDGALSWNYEGIYKEIPHKSFAPMNGVVVFNDTVRRKHMETLKLVFLTGKRISSGTLKDVSRLVEENGLVAVTTPGLAPEDVREIYTGGTLVGEESMSAGRWIITDNVADQKVVKSIRKYLGKEDEIRYVFGEREMIFTIKDDEITIKGI